MERGRGQVRQRLYTHDVQGVVRSNIPKYLSIRHRKQLVDFILVTKLREIGESMLHTSPHNQDRSALVDRSSHRVEWMLTTSKYSSIRRRTSTRVGGIYAEFMKKQLHRSWSFLPRRLEGRHYRGRYRISCDESERVARLWPTATGGAKANSNWYMNAGLFTSLLAPSESQIPPSIGPQLLPSCLYCVPENIFMQ